MSFFSEDIATGLPCYFEYIFDSWSEAYRLEKTLTSRNTPKTLLGQWPKSM